MLTIISKRLPFLFLFVFFSLQQLHVSAQGEIVSDQQRLENLFRDGDSPENVKQKVLSLLKSSQIKSEDTEFLVKNSSVLGTIKPNADSQLAEGIALAFIQKNRGNPKQLSSLQERLSYSGKIWFFVAYKVFINGQKGEDYSLLAKNILDSVETNINVCDAQKQEIVYSAFEFIVMSGFKDTEYLDSVIKTKFCNFESNRLYTAMSFLMNTYGGRVSNTVIWYFLQKAISENEMKLCLDYFDKYKVENASTFKAIKAEQIQRSVAAAVSLQILESDLKNPGQEDSLPLTMGLDIPKIDKQAPNFRIKGTNITLNTARGKNLILTFFPKCFTGGCANHLTSLNKVYAQIKDANTEVWAVSVDPAEGEKGQIAFAKKLGLQFRLIPDEDRKISLLYGAVNSPDEIDSRQTVYIGKDGKVEYVDRNVSIDTHGEDVLSKMKELGWVK